MASKQGEISVLESLMKWPLDLKQLLIKSTLFIQILDSAEMQ